MKECLTRKIYEEAEKAGPLPDFCLTIYYRICFNMSLQETER